MSGCPARPQPFAFRVAEKTQVGQSLANPVLDSRNMWFFYEGKSILAPANIFPPALQRRLPFPKYGIDVNFCKNPQNNLSAEPPDPFKSPVFGMSTLGSVPV